MNNLLLNLKVGFNNKFGKIFIILLSLYTWGYFNIYNYSVEEPNIYFFNFFLFDGIKPLMYFFSFLFLILVYNTFFQEDYNETYILKFSSRWKWFLSTYKFILFQALLFILVVLIISFCLSLFSIDMRNIWTNEYITNSFTDINVRLYNSIISISPIILLILNCINMFLFLSTLGILFMNLFILIKRKEFVISLIYGFLLFDNIVLFGSNSSIKNFFLIGNAKFIDYYINESLYSIIINKFLYFIIIIFFNMLIGKYLCKKVDFSKAKR